LSKADARAVTRLLGEVCAIADGRAAQIHHLMEGVTRLVNGDAWAWGLGVSLDPLALPIWLIQFRGGFDEESFAKFMRAQEHPDMTRLTAPFTELLMKRKAHLTRLRQQTDPEFRLAESPAYALWQASGVEPGILSVRPLDETAVSVVAVYRRCGAPLFDERDLRLAHILFTEVPWLHSRLDAGGETRKIPALSPRRRTILNLLLDGQSRQAIAEHLDVSVHTANEHIKEIYRHFGAHSQAELIGRFIHGDGGDA
jgi:DNA-binding CsgD family transcriptional regulator